MTRKKGYTPQHCNHKRSGRGYVYLDGKQIPTGVWGTAEADQKANELIARWLANGRKLPEEMRPLVFRVEDLVAEFWVHAQEHYRKHGKPTGEVNNVRDAVRPLLRLFGLRPADSFTPMDLEALQQHVVRDGRWARTTINSRINIVKRIFRWGVRRGSISGNTSHALTTVPALRPTKTNAREPEAVRPIAEEEMKAVLPLVPRPVAAMIQLQWHTAMRPGEVVQMRWADIDRSHEEWLYRPRRHKLEHLGVNRRVWLGPASQGILRDWRKVDPESPIFSPRAAEHERLERLRAERKAPLTPSAQRRRQDAARISRRKLRDSYSTNTYAQAIARACSAAGIPVWRPNQLRHAAAGRVRAAAGLDAAQVALGHANASTTELYASLDDTKARSIARQLG
jgi:integrase